MSEKETTWVTDSVLSLQKVKLRENASQMANLRWIRLNRTQLETIPDDVDNFTKLVSCGEVRS